MATCYDPARDADRIEVLRMLVVGKDVSWRVRDQAPAALAFVSVGHVKLGRASMAPATSRSFGSV